MTVRGLPAKNRSMVFISVQVCLLLLSMISPRSNCCHAADPEEDFSGYMEEINERERDAKAYAAKLDAHELWRQTTWGGWFVRTVQGLASHVSPFVQALLEASEQEGTGTRVLVHVGIRMLAVIIMMLAVYSLLKVVQLFIGKDITIVEEVVIVHEHDTEEEAAKARAEQKSKSRTKKSKTTKNE